MFVTFFLDGEDSHAECDFEGVVPTVEDVRALEELYHGLMVRMIKEMDYEMKPIPNE